MYNDFKLKQKEWTKFKRKPFLIVIAPNGINV